MSIARSGRRLLLSAATAMYCVTYPATPAMAQATPDTLISVCSGVSLPRSVVTGIMDPVVTGIYGPIETNINTTLGALSAPLLGITGLPGPLSVNVNGLLTSAASGSNIGLNVIAQDGSLVAPGNECNAQADSYTLDNPAGISIGGNAITGLGANGEEAQAGEIDSVAIGNNASTDATATGSVALGTDSSVGSAATGSVAIGSGSSATAANSVAIGAGSVASRGPQPGYTAAFLSGTQNSAGEVSVGAPGQERQITNVAPGSAPTDAANLGQLQAVAAQIPSNPVQYTDSTHTVVSLDGAGGTTVTNVAAGAVNASSTDAVNGSQLFAVDQQVQANTTAIANNTTAISNLQSTVATNSSDIANIQSNVATNTSNISNLQANVSSNTTAITNLQTSVTNLSNGAAGPVQYSNPSSPTTPNGGTPTNSLTLVGSASGPVNLHNVADGVVAAGSTDAVNGGQLNQTNQAVAAVQVTANQALLANQNAVTYDNSSRTSVTLNNSGPSVVVQNVAPGTAGTDAVNVNQLQSVASGAVTQANLYTDQRLSALDFDLGKVRRDARAGTAAALAAAGMPQPSDPGARMISVGVGGYRGRAALAFGASYRSENGKTIWKVGLTYDSSDYVGANGGFGYQF